MRVSREAAILLIVCAIYAIAGFSVYSDWVALPSPPFGGDYYYQHGQITRMYETGPLEWFGSSNGLGDRPGYFPVYGILVTIFGKMFGLEPLHAMLYFNLLVPYLCVFAFFFLCRELFEDDMVAMVLALLAFPGSIVLKYTDFTPLVIVPLFLLFLLRFYKEQKMENAIPLGIFYGILGLSHSSGFPIATALFLAASACVLWKKHKAGEINQKELLPFVATFIIGFAIAMIYWWEPLFIYHMSTNLQSEVWSLHDLRMQDVAFDTASNLITALFFNFSNEEGAIRSLLLLAGLGLAAYKKLWEKYTPLLAAFALVLAINFSFLITAPLFDIQFIPGYVFALYTSVFGMLMGGIALREFSEWKPEWWKYASIALALLLVFLTYENYHAVENSQYYSVAVEGLSPNKVEMAGWIRENTDVHDTILSTNEISFLLNALTGRELVVSRRAQNDVYMDDFDDRQMAAAVILYGNDIEERKRLLKEYGVDYIYVDYYWENSEYTHEGGGTQPFDPLLAVESPEYQELLDENGVKYFVQRGWLDPSVKGTSVRTYDLIYISWENYDFNGYGAWGQELDPYLEPVWVFTEQGYTLAVLYKVNLG